MNEQELSQIHDIAEQEDLSDHNLAHVFGCSTFVLVIILFWIILPFDGTFNFIIGLALALVFVELGVRIATHQKTIRTFISRLLG